MKREILGKQLQDFNQISFKTNKYIRSVCQINQGKVIDFVFSFE